MIYKNNDKKSDNIITNILEFCASNTFPKEFVSDNGPEFKNAKTEELCERGGITLFTGFHITLIPKVKSKDFIIQ